MVGFGLAWKVAKDAVPDQNRSAWGRPNGFGKDQGEPQPGDEQEDVHAFQGGWLNGERCKVCGQARGVHVEE